MSDIWEAFGDVDMYNHLGNSTGGSLAMDVLDTYNIPYNGNAGGSLQDNDIKRMDAMTVLRLSLLEDSFTGGFIEPIVNEAGSVEFKRVGEYSGNISDVYYTIQTGQWREPCTGVMITGGRPLPSRSKISWNNILDNARIYSYRDMLSNCSSPSFHRYSTIVYDDPNLNSSYADGIDNVYDIMDPFERIIGVVHRMDPGGVLDSSVTVDFVNTATIPIKLGQSLGVLQKLPKKVGDETCWTGEGEVVSSEGGVPIPNIDFRYTSVRDTIVDNFIGIKAVYVIGIDIDFMKPSPKSDSDAINGPSSNNTNIWVSIEDVSTKATRLRDGVNYAIAYEDGTPTIVFAADVRVNDETIYGDGVSYLVDPFCEYAESGNLTGIGNILPVSQTRGILVEDIWVLAEVSTPAIIISDPNGRAIEIAENFTYEIGVMTVVEEPAPIGYAGTRGTMIIDQTSSIKDHDPTTTQNFTNSELEDILDDMDGGGMALTLSFLQENEVLDAASTLYDFMKSSGSAQAVYTCGPNCRPQLGGYGNSGGIINSIQYSYTDSSSYTISVQEGPFLVGNLSQIDGGPSQKMAEDFGATGTIVSDLGNGIDYKVRIDGYGERYAMCMCPDILRVGDRVSCTVHNNPVEA